mmetsp:Transcript_7574/g.20687  ORF Transcript_7574/g.20687 Transcript_7574/m.20687 type:complete len:239 (+) Transcript_7574:825-1541(+)
MTSLNALPCSFLLAEVRLQQADGVNPGLILNGAGAVEVIRHICGHEDELIHALDSEDVCDVHEGDALLILLQVTLLHLLVAVTKLEVMDAHVFALPEYYLSAAEDEALARGALLKNAVLRLRVVELLLPPDDAHLCTCPYATKVCPNLCSRDLSRALLPLELGLALVKAGPGGCSSCVGLDLGGSSLLGRIARREHAHHGCVRCGGGDQVRGKETKGAHLKGAVFSGPSPVRLPGQYL